MKKANYDYKPEVVTTQVYNNKIKFDINLNIEEVKDGEQISYTADLYSFWVPVGELDPDTVKENPELYTDYVSQSGKQAYKNKAQAIVDKIRENPVVEIPSFRENAYINHRPSDDVKLLGGIMLGGLPYFELADGEVVALTKENLEGIMQDVAAWEVELQKTKQEVWDTIERAASLNEILDAFNLFDKFKSAN